MVKQNKRARILELLKEEPMKFTQIKKKVKISDQGLASNLKKLEKDGSIVYDHMHKLYSIKDEGKMYLIKSSVFDKMEKMPIASISNEKFVKMWEKFSRTEGVSMMHETLHSTIAFPTEEEKQAVREGKYIIPTGELIPATVFFWMDRKNQDMLQNTEQFFPAIDHLIAGMRILVATAREGKKPTDDDLTSNVKELKWLKASYDFECILLIHFDARNKKMLNFLNEHIGRGEKRLRSQI
jgi:DNA-binding PadR family transcriptional regulator